MSDRGKSDEAFRAFVQRVWRDDVAPVLRDHRGQRAASARWLGSAAGGAGLLLDGVLRLRGRPFTRMLTVIGASAGAMLPDLLDWSWLRSHASDADRAVLADAASRRAAEFQDAEAMALLGLTPPCTDDGLRAAWREAAHRWHPDRADAARRDEHRLRFIACQKAYERLEASLAAGRPADSRA